MEKKCQADKEYGLDKEYNIWEIVRYNLRMWWLAVLFALVGAAILGGYKYKSNHPLVEKVVYSNIQQATGSVYVKLYSDETALERVGTIMRISNSSNAYEHFIANTGWNLDFKGYLQLFDMVQGEVSDISSVYVNYPASYGDFEIADEATAIRYVEEVLKAVDETSQEILGQECIRIMDKPYATQLVEKIDSYYITNEEFWQGNIKAATAGGLLGIIVEIVLYTFWMLLYKKPKNAEEVRQCMDAPVIDTIKSGKDDEEIFRKVTLALKTAPSGCSRISCISLHSPNKEAALNVAKSYAKGQKKTLFIDLSGDGENGNAENSISGYILGGEKQPKPLALHEYLDAVYRTIKQEEGFDIVTNQRFTTYLEEKSKEYDYIIINGSDVSESVDAFAVAKLCDTNFLVCGRKNVTNEMLYRAKNEADVYGIEIGGILIYE